MVSARGLGFRLRSRDILAAVDFALPRGAFLAVVGENGAGKTTLLDLLLGFRRRTAGDLVVLNHDPGTDPWRTRLRIAYLSEKVDLPGD
jgi:ABC-2 type transport system ATP-binding protein